MSLKLTWHGKCPQLRQARVQVADVRWGSGPSHVQPGSLTPCYVQTNFEAWLAGPVLSGKLAPTFLITKKLGGILGKRIRRANAESWRSH